MEDFIVKDGVLVSYKGNGGDVVIPENLGISEISNYAFAYPIGADEDYPKITSVVVPEGVEILDDGAFQSSHIEKIILPATLKKIGLRVFRDCTKLHDIDLPENLEEIGQESFMHCENLLNIKIPKKIANIGILSFNNCYSLNIDVSENPLFNYNSGILFDNEKNLISCTGKEQNVIIPEGTKIIPKEFFRHIETIENVQITGTVNKIESSAFYQSLIKAIYIPNQVEEIGSQCFQQCGLLTSVMFEPNSKLKSISRYAFNKCSSLMEISLPEGLCVIEQGAFDSCKSLRMIVIPENLQEIQKGAFWKCKNLENVVLPNKDIRISKQVFNDCDSLSDEIKKQILELQIKTEKGLI